MSRINYRLEDIRALMALARLGSFVRSAESLNITQSAFSRRIAQLEDAVGGRLVERTSRRVSLSALGESLVQDTKALLLGLDQSVEEAHRQARGESGRVTLACLTTVACSRLPLVLSQFRETYPQVRLHVRDDTGQRVTQCVLRGEAEFGVSVLGPEVQGLSILKVAQDPFVLAVSAHHPLAQVAEVTWRDLAHWRPVTLSPHSANRQHIDEGLAREGLSPPWFDEVEHLSTMLGFLRHAHHVGVLPRMALDAGATELVVRPLVGPVLSRDIGLIRRSETTLNRPAQLLWDLLHTNLKQ